MWWVIAYAALGVLTWLLLMQTPGNMSNKFSNETIARVGGALWPLFWLSVVYYLAVAIFKMLTGRDK